LNELLVLQEFLPWAVLLIFPLIVLAVGAAASFLSPLRRKTVGIFLITFGVFELVFLAGTIEADVRGGFGVPIGIVVSVAVGVATFVSGIMSLVHYGDPLQTETDTEKT
jgi:hypothetical protein